MNQFFYESRGKEKVKELLKEGQRSQAYYRSGTPKPGFLSRLPKLILILVGILGILELLVP
jgi:hypothetical protein